MYVCQAARELPILHADTLTNMVQAVRDERPLYKPCTLHQAPRRGRMRVPRAPEECPQDVVDLINECLAVEASARPTARELVERLLGMRRGSETVSGSF